MKPFVREREDEIRIGLGVVLAGIILITGELFGEVAYLPLIVAYAAQLAWEFQRWLRNRAKERSAEARSTGSR